MNPVLFKSQNISKKQISFSCSKFKYNFLNHKKGGIRFRLFLVSFLMLIIFQLDNCLAQEIIFDPEYIISDHQLTDHQSMDFDQVQKFLNQANGALKDYRAVDVDGREKSAAEIIYRASQEYKINPQVLITLLQREKSLITKKSPTNDDYNWATGFTCYDYASPVSRFRGFARQVDRAAWRFRYYLEHPWQFQFRVGITTKTLSNSKDRTLINKFGRFIIPKNMATASLYIYAPHLYDNWLFWQIWQNWFADKQQEYPEGSLLRIKNEKGVWLIQNGQRKPFYSKTVFLLSYKFENVKDIEAENLQKYPIGAAVSFPNYSLVKSKNEIFMLIDNIKRPISEKMFKNIGFHPEEVILVEDSDLSSYQEGNPVLSPYPSGALLQDNNTNAVYYVKDNFKYPIIDISILQANYPYSHIIKVNPMELADFETKEQIKFRDGTLIKSFNLPTVYIIIQGKRLPIISAEVFEALGYQWDNIIQVDESILNTYSLGESLNI
ncbi:MAG: hypothetical protein PHG59_01070 [Patescibacteria group bacterium]|jgi:hypothetical protein|nr:hypothetical protein [Patescibacteria group bacterium]